MTIHTTQEIVALATHEDVSVKPAFDYHLVKQVGWTPKAVAEFRDVTRGTVTKNISNVEKVVADPEEDVE